MKLTVAIIEALRIKLHLLPTRSTIIPNRFINDYVII